MIEIARDDLSLTFALHGALSPPRGRSRAARGVHRVRDASLKRAACNDAAKVCAQRYDGLSNLGADSAQHHLRSEEPDRARGADQRVCYLGVHRGNAGDVEDRDARTALLDPCEQRLEDLLA